VYCSQIAKLIQCLIHFLPITLVTPLQILVSRQPVILVLLQRSVEGAIETLTISHVGDGENERMGDGKGYGKGEAIRKRGGENDHQ
jgi:hypothetical protein